MWRTLWEFLHNLIQNFLVFGQRTLYLRLLLIIMSTIYAFYTAIKHSSCRIRILGPFASNVLISSARCYLSIITCNVLQEKKITWKDSWCIQFIQQRQRIRRQAVSFNSKYQTQLKVSFFNYNTKIHSISPNYEIFLMHAV